SGYVVDVAQHDGNTMLEAGDVVVVSGSGPAVVGEIPLVKVRRAEVAETRGVIGVVDQRYESTSRPAASKDGTDVKVDTKIDDSAVLPGDYLTVVTLGSFKAIKVDASYGAIGPGDLLVASLNPGYAMRSESPKPGTIVGKALDRLESGTGTIPVVVTLQ
ncbi:MAG: hypothetical protein WAW06_07675, partial [bacterium]